MLEFEPSNILGSRCRRVRFRRAYRCKAKTVLTGSRTSELKRILVIGGTQFIGTLLVQELLRAGHEVYILHRRSAATRSASASTTWSQIGMTPQACARAVGAIRFDAVYDNAYDWERGTTSAQVEATAQFSTAK